MYIQVIYIKFLYNITWLFSVVGFRMPDKEESKKGSRCRHPAQNILPDLLVSNLHMPCSLDLGALYLLKMCKE